MSVIHTIGGINCITLREFAKTWHSSEIAVRYLLGYGKGATRRVVRKLSYLHVEKHYYIPCVELEGYPCQRAGHSNNEIYHHKGAEKILCESCTYGEPCEARKKADAVYSVLTQEVKDANAGEI